MRSRGEEEVEDVIEAVTEVVGAEADEALSVSSDVSAVLAFSALVATFLALLIQVEGTMEVWNCWKKFNVNSTQF